MRTRAQPGPAWIRCASCENFWCVLHQKHVFECACPSIEWWARRNLDPYRERPPRAKTRTAMKVKRAS